MANTRRGHNGAKFGYAADRIGDAVGGHGELTEAQNEAARRLVEKAARDAQDRADLLAKLGLVEVSA